MYGVSDPTVDALAQDYLTTALPSWLTVTRGAGSWSRQTAAAVHGTTFIELGTDQNTGRFDYSDSVGRSMLLIEPTRTNIVTHSNFLEAVVDDNPDGWANNAGVAGVNYNTVATGGPHGGAYWQRENVGNGGVFQACALVADTLYQVSAWVHGTSIGAANQVLAFLLPTTYMDLPTGTFDWQRVFVAATSQNPAGVSAYMQTSVAADGVLREVLLQIEAGDCATSPIPTQGAAVARAAELCAVDPSVIGANQGYISFLWRPDYASTAALSVSPVLFQWAPNWELYFDPADDKLKLTVDSAAGAESAALTFARQGLLHVAVRYGSFGTRLYVDGVETTDASAWGTPALAPYLGSRAASANCRPSAYGNFLSTAV